MNPRSDWHFVNLRLIAKSIGELTYEEVLSPELVSSKGQKSGALYQDYVLRFEFCFYTFKAWESIWGHLRVHPLSIERKSAQGKSKEIAAAQFFMDAQKTCQMNDMTLAQFIEEMNSSLYSDLIIHKKRKSLKSKDWLQMSFVQMQSYLDGHPKILLNKGRLGWSPKDIQNFSPESEAKFCLSWLYVKKDKTSLNKIKDERLLWSALSEKEIQKSENYLSSLGLDLKDYLLMPVHPWQWLNVIQLHYLDEIQNQEIIYLGEMGDTYQPQISVRTLSNISNPQKPDVKLPLMILNTSAVRGISKEGLNKTGLMAEAIEDLTKRDKVLNERLFVLKDLVGLSFLQKNFKKINKPSYKYLESLGALCRESIDSRLEPGESAIMTGALSEEDSQGQILIMSLVEASGIGLKEWLQAYFQSLIIPLYHLQIKYGIGVVAHGQNTVLRLKNNIPSGVFIKDFQGDVRRCSGHSFNEKNLKSLTSIPSNYLIHDLFTGHIISVLRFISAGLFEKQLMSEQDFYFVLSEVLEDYFKAFPLSQSQKDVDLRRPYFEKVLLNKVRFHLGYIETAERLQPFLGSDLSNPIMSKGGSYETNL